MGDGDRWYKVGLFLRPLLRWQHQATGDRRRDDEFNTFEVENAITSPATTVSLRLRKKLTQSHFRGSETIWSCDATTEKQRF